MPKRLIVVNPGDGVLAAGTDSDSRRSRCVEPASGCATRISQHFRRRDCASRCASRVFAFSRCAGVASSTRPRAWWRLTLSGEAVRHGSDDSGRGLDVAMAAESADAIVAIGGTGSGRNDSSVQTLAREGQLTVHGMALTPGETSAFGFVGVRPVLLLPGRLDAALSVWLIVGRPLARPTGGGKSSDNEPTETLTLARKVSSTIGLAEVVPVRRNGTEGGADGNQISVTVIIDPL